MKGTWGVLGYVGSLVTQVHEEADEKESAFMLRLYRGLGDLA